MRIVKTEILVVGGGGAGMSAALVAADCGADVAVADENPYFGGQIWRRGIDGKDSFAAAGMIKRLGDSSVRFIPGTTVFDRSGDSALLASGPDGTVELQYRRLVIATGARERFIPFPGWTLPNVFGAGGLQALVKSGFSVEGKKIIVAGTGPLLLAVAEYLKSKGANVMFVAEQAGNRALAGFAVRLAAFPSKLRQAVEFRMRPGAVPLKRGSFIVKADGAGKLESVSLNGRGRIEEFECELLAVGFHLLPNLELPLLLGCEAGDEGIVVNEFQETSVANVFASGETTGIGGIELSCVEGEIAGYAAAGNQIIPKYLFKNRRKYKRFAYHVNRAFELGGELRDASTDETFVCRCEDVTFGELKNFDCWRDAKLQTRCGMGPCQGRVCGPAAKYLFGWKTDGIRPPIFPVELENLVVGNRQTANGEAK